MLTFAETLALWRQSQIRPSPDSDFARHHGPPTFRRHSYTLVAFLRTSSICQAPPTPDQRPGPDCRARFSPCLCCLRVPRAHPLDAGDGRFSPVRMRHRHSSDAGSNGRLRRDIPASVAPRRQALAQRASRQFRRACAMPGRRKGKPPFAIVAQLCSQARIPAALPQAGRRALNLFGDDH
jgi:hypothetical protein